MKIFRVIGAGIAVTFCLAGCGGVGVGAAGTPAISQVVPQFLVAGSPSAMVEVVGAQVNSSTVILWNGSPLNTTLVNDSTLASPVDGSSIAAPGTVQLQLMNGITGSKSDAVLLPITASTSTSALTISTTTLPNGVVGTQYSTALVAAGGSAPYSWQITSGTMPTGLSLNGNNISGIPTAAGTFSVGLTVTDSSKPAQSKFIALAIVVSPKPVTSSPLAVSTTSLPSASVNTAYLQTLQATGGTGPYQWTITSGKLPAGLMLAPTTGTITGTPSVAGTSTFTATVSDNSTPVQTASLAISLLVNPSQSTLTAVTPLSIVAPASISGTVGSAYTLSLGATGGMSPYTWSIQSGTLPAGLNLSSTGVISGTPASGANGSYSVTISVADAESPSKTMSVTMTLTISAAPVVTTPVSILSSTNLASGRTGTSYNQTLQASGGTAPYSWNITSGSLPSGLTLSSTGTISGTPTGSGTSTFTVQVADSSSQVQTQSASLSITIAAAQNSATGGVMWFVRQGGGTLYNASTSPSGQCDGHADVDYPGTGTGQHCAVANLQYLYPGGNSWVIAGGDTIVIRGCAALPGEQNSSAPDCRIGPTTSAGGCVGLCYAPPPPAGSSSAHTVIEGGCAYDGNCQPANIYPYTSNLAQIFGGFSIPWTLSVQTQYLDLKGLEFTTHNGTCTHYGVPVSPMTSCSTATPLSDFASNGLLSDNTSANISLTDVYFHGFTASGIQGPIGGPWLLNRVIFGFNAFAGWNFGDYYDTPDAAGSTITQTQVIMIGNGCVEQYPIANAQFPALKCYDTNDAGFGDSWSGQDTNLDTFTCDQCTVAYNTKDGLIGPHTLIKNLSLTRSAWYGNMGSALKWGTQPNGSTVFQDNYVNSNCYAMSGTVPGAPVGYNSQLTGWCRAGGSPFAINTSGNSTFNFSGNTIVDGVSPTILQMSCVIAGTCSSTTWQYADNIFLGYTVPSGYGPFGGALTPAVYYTDDTPSTDMIVVSSHNLFFGTRNDDCSGGYGGVTLTSTSPICSSPLLTGQPAAYSSESVFYNFNLHPIAASPAIDAGMTLPGLTTDYYGVARPVPPTIGAVEP